MSIVARSFGAKSIVAISSLAESIFEFIPAGFIVAGIMLKRTSFWGPLLRCRCCVVFMLRSPLLLGPLLRSPLCSVHCFGVYSCGINC